MYSLTPTAKLPTSHLHLHLAEVYFGNKFVDSSQKTITSDIGFWHFFKYLVMSRAICCSVLEYPSGIHAELFRWHRSGTLEYDFVVRLAY